MNNPAFGKCAKFDDPVLVEADSFRNSISDITFDSSNVAIECWVRPADEMLALPGDGTVYHYYIFDRWGEIDLKIMQLADGSFQIQAMVWDANAVANYLTVPYATVGLDPSNWVHIRFENYLGEAKLYLNGSLAASKTLDTASLDTPLKSTNIIGARYNPKEYFWGYIDEMKISQVEADLECGLWGYLPGDINEDCVVNLEDLKLLVDEWLKTTEPSDPLAVEGEMLQYENYNIPLASVTPTIDGTLSSGEWNDATSIFLGMPELTTPPNIGSTIYELPDSHADFSGVYYYKWDADYLYVGAKVYDDVLLFDAGYPDDHFSIGVDILDQASSTGELGFFDLYLDTLKTL
jgi:hypothetical protein